MVITVDKKEPVKLSTLNLQVLLYRSAPRASSFKATQSFVDSTV